LNISNWITISRALLAPITVILLINDMPVLAFVLFIVSALSDVIDGFLARLLNQKTALGGFLDPMADKILVIFNLVALVEMKLLPLWYMVLTISKDLFLLIGFFLTYILLKKTYILPSILGKLTTFFQLMTIGFVMMQHAHLIEIEDTRKMYLIYLSAGFTIISWLDYMIRGLIHLNHKMSPDLSAQKMKVKQDE